MGSGTIFALRTFHLSRVLVARLSVVPGGASLILPKRLVTSG